MWESFPLAQNRAAEEPHGGDEATDGGGEGEDFEAGGVVGAGGVHGVEEIEAGGLR